MAILETQKQTGAGWRTMRYDTRSGRDCARYVARERYAWPGGRVLVAVCGDGEYLCPACCRENYREIARAADDTHSGWHVLGMEAFEPDGEPDSIDTCAHCGAHLSDL